MKKYLKDYLHLYLWNSVYLFPPDTWTNGWCAEKKNKNGFYEGWGFVILTPTNFTKIIEDGYVLALRPISDMNDDDRQKHLKTETNNGAVIITTHFESFRELLKDGFDLFGLIEAGLAIDKTKNQ